MNFCPTLSPVAGRPAKPEEAKRIKISQRIDPQLHAWVKEQIEAGRFKDWPHALDAALRALQSAERQKR